MWMIKDDAKGKFLGCQTTPKSEVSDQDMSGGPTLKTEVKDEPEDISGRQFNNLQSHLAIFGVILKLLCCCLLVI